MMSRRRITFQLVSLFDLLMIVIFAQYLDVQERTTTQVRRSQQVAALAAQQAQDAKNRLTQDQADLEATRLMLAQLEQRLQQLDAKLQAEKTATTQEKQQLSDELRKSRDDLLRIGTLTAQLFHIPEEVLARILRSRTPAESAKIKQELKSLASSQGPDMVRHVLTVAELHKRCDIWDVHLDDTGRATITAAGKTESFRAENPATFEADVFRFYKTLPQPKSIVIILLSWSNTDLASRRAAMEGLDRSTDHLRLDTDRRTRFESAVLGYLPR